MQTQTTAVRLASWGCWVCPALDPPLAVRRPEVLVHSWGARSCWAAWGDMGAAIELLTVEAGSLWLVTGDGV